MTAMPALLSLVLILLAPPAQAMGEELLLTAYQQDDCVVMLMADQQSKMLRIRTRSDASLCRLDFKTLEAVLTDGLSQLPNGTDWTSFYLGRAVEHRWLSLGLAEAALFEERWDAERGTSTEGHPNALVAELMAQPELVRRIYPVFRAHGLRVIAVGVEKVLGMNYHELVGEDESCSIEAIVPFDAQVWLQLRKTTTEEQAP